MSYVIFGSGVFAGASAALVAVQSAVTRRRYVTHPGYLAAKRRINAAKEKAHA